MGTTFGITHTFKGGTAEQYDRSIKEVQFRDETLLPGLAKVEGGLVGPPEEVSFQVHNSASA
jgi:predicted transcriptional regulator